jgi:hypothetical protein
VKKRVKISVRGAAPNEFKRVAWAGHIVAGTDCTMAVTKAAVGYPAKPGTRWTPTHLPTGYTSRWLETDNFSKAVKNAKRLYALLLKHEMPVKDPKMHEHFTPALKNEAAKKFKPKWAL